MSADQNRRRAERVRVNDEFAGVDQRARKPGSRSRQITYVSDLSESGVFVHTQHRLPLGTQVNLRFTVIVDDPVVIRGTGRVVRHQDDPAGVGVEFGPLSPEMVLRIQDVLARQRRALGGDETGATAGGASSAVADVGRLRAGSRLDDDDGRTAAFKRVDASIPAFDSGEFELLEENGGENSGDEDGVLGIPSDDDGDDAVLDDMRTRPVPSLRPDQLRGHKPGRGRSGG